MEGAWFDALESREYIQVKHALAYAREFSSAGVPGHNHLLLIAKLAKMLDHYTDRPGADDIKDQLPVN